MGGCWLLFVIRVFFSSLDADGLDKVGETGRQQKGCYPPDWFCHSQADLASFFTGRNSYSINVEKPVGRK